MPNLFAVPNTDSSKHSSTHRHPKFIDGTHKGKYPEITTLYQLFMDNVIKNPEDYFLGARQCSKDADVFGHYKWISTTEAATIVENLGAGLENVFKVYAPDINPVTNQQPLGIFSMSRPEWMLTELAGFRYSKYSVGIWDDVETEQYESQINEADIQVLVCSIDKISRLLSRIEMMPKLKVIISMDNFDLCKPTVTSRVFSLDDVSGLHTMAKSLDITLFDFKAVIEMGKLNPTPPVLPKPSDYSMLLFKQEYDKVSTGILHTHQSSLHCSRSMYLSLDLGADVVHLSHLPLAKSFEHSVIYMLMFSSVCIGFHSGSSKRILEDMQFLHPTILVSLPAHLEELHGTLVSKVNDLYPKQQNNYYGNTRDSRHIVFQKSQWDSNPENLRMCPGIDFRLRNFPKKDYKVTDSPNPRGEVMIRAKSKFSSYYKQPEKTDESMDGEWFATGRSGTVTESTNEVYFRADF
ncbi:medium-chain fatty acid-CoA ligase faa2 [Coemansia asiatica]|uniref:Medium-chain fatty acid-CoA ligase faa2 n=1 Tax=Coemansia asiatica TaxID=1052880 RepID=A0A9W7XL42_9FUNG|nr:medium-chain fatty acid-CoA ligase faa2 [Coemansia asiatica]